MKIKDIKYFNINKTEVILFEKGLENKRHNHLWKYVINDMNILASIKIISRNSGSKTPGPDGIKMEEIIGQNLESVISEIKNRLYGKVKPEAREVLIPKDNGKVRPLGITNLYDRIAQQCIKNVLEPILEAQFNPESFGFRKDRNAKECMSLIASSLQHLDEGMVYDCDLKSYFDTVQIDIVLNKLRENHNIHDKQFLSCIKRLMWIDLVNPKVIYEGIGLKQGTILGPILANVMFHDFEIKLHEFNDHKRKNGRELISNPNIFKNFGKNYKRGKEFYFNWLGNKRVVKIIRYADDFILISKGKYDIYDAIILLNDWCKENGLEINEDKTKLLKINKGKPFKLEFLGYKYTKMNTNQRGNTFIIAPANQKKIWKETKSKLRWSLYHNKPKYFISYIRGIFQYFDICTNMTWLISKIHAYLFKFKYRRKGKRKRKYIEYVSSSDSNAKYSHFIINNVKFDLWEMRVNSVRNTKSYMYEVNKLWNPQRTSYKEISWVEEFYDGRDRGSNRNTANLIYVPSLLRQQKKDPIMQFPLLQINPKRIVIHHKRRIYDGGKDEYKNLMLLHETTHKLVHSTNPQKSLIKSNYDIKKLNQLRKTAGNKPITA